jgi:hypothetical protein
MLTTLVQKIVVFYQEKKLKCRFSWQDYFSYDTLNVFFQL